MISCAYWTIIKSEKRLYECWEDEHMLVEAHRRAAEDIEKTIGLLKDLLPEDIGVSISYPLPGTVFYEKVKKDLSAKANWTDDHPEVKRLQTELEAMKNKRVDAEGRMVVEHR